MITGSETVHVMGRTAPILVEGRLPLLDAADVLQLGLRDGQIVRPAVEVMSGQLKLLLQGQRWDLSPAWRSLAGQWLTLEVHLLPSGGAQLRPLAPGGPTRASTPSPAAPQKPTQTGVGGTSRVEPLALRPLSLHAWSALMQPGELAQLAQTLGTVSNPLGRALERLIIALPRMQELNADALRQAIADSGLLTEARLAAGLGASSRPDLKDLLRQSLPLLEADRGHWGGRIAEAIDDIEAAQLQSTDAVTPRESWLSLVLGFRDHAPVRLRFEQPGPGQPDGPVLPWIVHVDSESPAYGALKLRCAIHRGGRVDLTLWLTHSPWADHFRAGLGALRADMVALGLFPGSLEVLSGEPPDSSRTAERSGLGQRLDLRA
jgi:hypothetical protein